MSTKLNRWGNSLGLRLPQHVVEAAGLAAGDYLYIRLLDSGEIMIRTAKPGRVPPGYRAGEGDHPVPSQQVEAESKW